VSGYQKTAERVRDAARKLGYVYDRCAVEQTRSAPAQFGAAKKEERRDGIYDAARQLLYRTT